MKLLKIDPIRIAVKSIAESKDFWIDCLGLYFEKAETVQEQKVTTGGVLVELREKQ